VPPLPTDAVSRASLGAAPWSDALVSPSWVGTPDVLADEHVDLLRKRGYLVLDLPALLRASPGGDACADEYLGAVRGSLRALEHFANYSLFERNSYSERLSFDSRAAPL